MLIDIPSKVQSFSSLASKFLRRCSLPGSPTAAHLMRSMAGGYDNESIAVSAICLTFCPRANLDQKPFPSFFICQWFHGFHPRSAEEANESRGIARPLALVPRAAQPEELAHRRVRGPGLRLHPRGIFLTCNKPIASSFCTASIMFASCSSVASLQLDCLCQRHTNVLASSAVLAVLTSCFCWIAISKRPPVFPWWRRGAATSSSST